MNLKKLYKISTVVKYYSFSKIKAIIIYNSSFIIIAALLLCANFASAQQYPVQGSLAINSPYPAYLSDYANPNIEKLILNLTLTDLNIANKRVKLKLFIQKKNSLIAQTADNIIGEPVIILDGGVPQRFTSIDLANYFKIENLQGINGNAYSQPLPEGVYNIGFEVYDYFTGNKLSNRIGQLFWLMLNDPPLLNMPRNKENILDANPNNPQIVFQWTPRTTQVTNTEYEFTLSELWDDAGDPYQQFLAAIPKYQTTISNTTLLYGITEPPLLAGRTYAWRVKAKAKAGFDDIGLYRQNGYSEIFVFKYAGQCAAVQGVNIEVKGYDRMYITWQPNPNQSLYKVAYRKYTPSNNWEWHETESFNPYLNLFDLEANTDYEIKVGGVCDGGLVSYSNPQTKKTLQNGQIANVNCGQAPTIDISNKTLIERLNVNDVVMANDFPITLTKVEGGSGVYSGEGWVKVPWLADCKIKVKYTGIKVNTDKKLIDGFFETTYDPSGKNIGDIDQTIQDLIGFIKDIQDIFATDGNGSTGIAKVSSEISNTDIGSGNFGDMSKDAQMVINNSVQPPASNTAQQALNNMKAAKQVYDSTQKQLDSTSDPIAKQALQQKSDSLKTAYTAAQQNLSQTLTLANEMIKYHFPDSAWFAAIDTFLVKYKGINADISLAQYYWHKQTDSAYNIVTNTYNLPDSLQQSLDNTNQDATPAWSGLQQGVAILHLKNNGGGVANYNGRLLDNNNTKEVGLLVAELQKDVQWHKLNSIQFNGMLPLKFLNPDNIHIGYSLLTPSGSVIVLPKETIHILFFHGIETPVYMKVVTGSLVGFMINNVEYKASFDTNGNFLGYKNDISGLYYKNDLTKNSNIDRVVMALPNIKLTLYAFSINNANKYSFSTEKVVPETETTLELFSVNKIIDGLTEEYSYKNNPGVYGNGILDINQQEIDYITEYPNSPQILALSKVAQIQALYPRIFTKFIDRYGSKYKDWHTQAATTQAKAIGVSIEDYFKLELKDLIYFLATSTTVPKKNILLMVNGYRVTYNPFTEKSLPINNQIYFSDVVDDGKPYWEGIDNQFADLLKSLTVIYADGHNSITTSNHRSKSAFLNSIKTSELATTVGSSIASSINPLQTILCWHNNNCVHLDTTPYIDGFNVRYKNGVTAGNNLIKKINNKEIIVNKDAAGNITDTLDIVCHSMGYAYVLGMVDAIKQSSLKIHFGRFYIIAPEDAGAGNINLPDFEEVWQYGADLDRQDQANRAPLWLQDGIAPQAAVQGLNTPAPNRGRVYIPPNGVPRGFINSHQIKNYGWIFSKLTNGDNGYVKPRQ